MRHKVQVYDSTSNQGLEYNALVGNGVIQLPASRDVRPDRLVRVDTYAVRNMAEDLAWADEALALDSSPAARSAISAILAATAARYNGTV